MTIRKSYWRQRLTRPRAARRGFTFTEFLVALIVFGVALSGLLPLVAILSRELQPVGQASMSPARDYSNADCPDTARRPATWYLAAYDDPWVRKLGASAKLALSAGTSSTPFPLEPSVRYLDDYEGVGPGASDGIGVFTAGTASTLTSASPGYKGDYHYAEGSTTQPIATWRIPVAAEGWYSVQATWPASSGLALTNVTYIVNAPNNAPNTLSLTLNQASPGAGISDADGVPWWPITPASNRCVFLRKNDAVTVTLAAVQVQTSVFVIADAVRVVQNEVTVNNSVERSPNGQNNNSNGAVVTAKVSAAVNIPQ
jgi:prepilin-type N-terminal cleavage/methylation domain-containing protein